MCSAGNAMGPRRDISLGFTRSMVSEGQHICADEMFDVVRDFYLAATQEEGFPGARGTGEMSWCLVEGRADADSVMDYEARLSLLLAEYPYTACCQYDARLFDGETIMDVLSVHPVMIVRGQLVRNPYYVPPETFLAEYEARREGTAQ